MNIKVGHSVYFRQWYDKESRRPRVGRVREVRTDGTIAVTETHLSAHGKIPMQRTVILKPESIIRYEE